MTLKENFQDAKAQMQRELTESFGELEREAGVIDRLKTQCQRSHRCVPSLTMFGFLIGLLVLHWCLESWRTEQMEASIRTAWEQLSRDVQVQVDKLEAAQRQMELERASVVAEAPLVAETPPRHWWSRRR